ncbi:MAG: S8 family serine peptidase, partial [Candidatus Competibacteraceae bacterium]|nr:S8 family serine peptidase [Candidatus Competibacteraceae bacterium]
MNNNHFIHTSFSQHVGFLIILLLLIGVLPITWAQGDIPLQRADKVSPTLIAAGNWPAPEAVQIIAAASGRLSIVADSVLIDFYAAEDANALLADLVPLGLKNYEVYRAVVSGYLPLSSISSLQTLDTLKFAMESVFITDAGAVDNEAVDSMAVDVARSLYDVDGTGITVGILSDSFDCGQFGGLPGTANPNRYADDIASGDLPADVLVLEDWTCGNDEGRAMAQLVYDVAPGVKLAFHTASGGLANFAQGIIDLADAGADIIVDDILYLSEPMFADGIIAQAVDEVSARGIPFFSSAGNRATAAYESPFVDSGVVYDLATDLAVPPGSITWKLHDFDPGLGVDPFQKITVEPGSAFNPWLQWSDAYFDPFGDGRGTGTVNPGAQSDIDILPFVNGTFDISLYFGLSNIGYIPLDILNADYVGQAGETFEIAIGLFSGPPPELMRYVDFADQGALQEYGNNAPTLYGHNNAGGRTGNAENDPEAIGAVAVGAAFWGTTPAYGENPPLLNAFSSYGPTPIYYDIFGNRYTSPIVEPKPQITAPDGSNTTFFFSDDEVRDADTLPNFFGTSAAAPHAAAVAALMLQVNPTLTPRAISEKLQLSAIDILGTNDVGDAYPYNQNVALPAGFDFASGAGLIQADVAVKLSIATITVKKVVSNAADAPSGVDFAFASDALGAFSLQDQGEQVFSQLPADSTYSLSETVLPNWTLTDASCSSSTGASIISPIENGQSIELAPADDVICTFTNTFDDGDSSTASEEDSVPGYNGSAQGDGNGDGIADKLQLNVSSVQAGTCWWTLASDGLQHSEVMTVGVPAEAPTTLAYPCDFLAFAATLTPEQSELQV